MTRTYIGFVKVKLNLRDSPILYLGFDVCICTMPSLLMGLKLGSLLIGVDSWTGTAGVTNGTGSETGAGIEACDGGEEATGICTA
jgi:hypothetical protein